MATMTTAARANGLRRALGASALALIAGCGTNSGPPSEDMTPREGGAPSNDGSAYLFVWSGDADELHSDFLAVIDANRSSARYGEIVATAPVGAGGTLPHHTEYEYPAGGVLFANGWLAGETYLIDVATPSAPKLAGKFKSLGGYSYPHSFARLKNGNVLATFQGTDGYGAPGGLVEIDPAGRAVRSVSVTTPDIPDDLAWPYSLAISPDGARAVVAMSEMGMPPFEEFDRTNHVQVWSTDDLRLVASVALPQQTDGEHHLDPAEPRFLADGAVLVSTFTCGLYRIDGVDTDTPGAELVHTFPGGTTAHNACAVPVVVGDYWVQMVPEINGLIALDVSDPAAPREVSRLSLDAQFTMPHWVAADRKSGRLVATGMDGSWVLVVDIDPATGALSLDERFRDAGAAGPGVSFDRPAWPHGEAGKAVVHGALFGD